MKRLINRFPLVDLIIAVMFITCILMAEVKGPVDEVFYICFKVVLIATIILGFSIVLFMREKKYIRNYLRQKKAIPPTPLKQETDSSVNLTQEIPKSKHIDEVV